jgi:hypothetical protein
VYVVLIVVGLALIIGIALVNSRLDSLEDGLSYRAPVGDVSEAVGEGAALAEGSQAAYVPVYSHIYTLGGRPLLLETTLSVRNTDISETLVVTSVRYFDTDGKQVRSFLDGPLTLGPLATAEFLIEAKDTSGGSGANFIVEWNGGESLNPPLIEAVMVGMDGTHGMAFTSQAEEMATP